MLIRLDKKKRIQGFLPQTKRIFEIFYKMNILDNFKSIIFCFHTFGVRRLIDVLDSENQPGSGSRALGFTEDVLHQKYENKKGGFLKSSRILIYKI